MDIFQEVKDRITTMEAAQHYGVILQKKGSRYWCLCPFHDDKAPSLVIFPDDGFKCFSCGIGGADSISFTARLFNLSMVEAAKRMVSDFSIPGFDDTRKDIPKNQDELTYSDFIKGFRLWEEKTFDDLCRIYQVTGKLLKIWKPEEDLFAELVMIRANTDLWTDILIYGDFLDKFNLLKKLKEIGWG